MPTIAELGQKVKAKYPGQYNDLSDAELGQRVKTKYPDAYGDFSDPVQAPATPVPQGFAQQHEGAIRYGLGMLPAAGATVGAILGGGGGALAGLPEAGVGAIPGAAVGGTAGLAAGAGAGRALENLGLKLIGLKAEPGFIHKLLKVDPDSPTGQTLSTIQEMAINAGMAKGVSFAAGKPVPKVDPKFFESAAGALKTPEGQLIKKTAGHSVLGPLYPVLEYLGAKVKRQPFAPKAAEQLGQELQRDPLFNSLGGSIAEKPAVLDAGQIPGSTSRGFTPRPNLFPQGPPAPRPLAPQPLGAGVEQLPGMESSQLPSAYETALQAERQAQGEAVRKSLNPPTRTPAWQGVPATGPAPVPETAPIRPEKFPMGAARQARRAEAAAMAEPPPRPTPKGEVRPFAMAPEDPVAAMEQSIALEQKMSEMGLTGPQKAVVRRSLMLGKKIPPLKLGNLPGMRTSTVIPPPR